MKITTIVLASLFYLLSYSHDSIQVKSPAISIYEISFHEQIMCSGERFPRCTGSVYCRACKNCKYCKYCNSGGSCGVCGKKPKSHYSTPKKKKPYSPSNTLFDNESTKNQSGKKKEYAGKTFYVIKKTSLRTAGSSKARVIKRLKENERVIVIESKDKYWWLVSVGKNVGWVKQALLKQKPNYP